MRLNVAPQLLTSVDGCFFSSAKFIPLLFNAKPLSVNCSKMNGRFDADGSLLRRLDHHGAPQKSFKVEKEL